MNKQNGNKGFPKALIIALVVVIVVMGSALIILAIGQWLEQK
jgi:hypothetical protein